MKSKFIFRSGAAMILLLFVAMIGYNVYDSDRENYKNEAKFLRAIAFTEEFKTWESQNTKALLSYDQNAIPYLDGTEGFFVDYFDLIGDELGIEITWKEVSHSEATLGIKEGKIHGFIVISDDPLAKQGSITMPIIPVKGVLCTRAESDVTSGKNLLLNPIIVVSGSPGERYADKHFAGGNIIRADTFSAAMSRFTATDSAVFAGNESAVWQYLSRSGLTKEYKTLDGYIFEENYCLVIPDKHSGLYSAINSGIYNINSEIVVPKLQGKWFGLSYPLSRGNDFERSGIVLVIVIASMLCMFLLFYTSNKGVYSELTNRTEVLLSSKRELEATFDGVTYDIAEVDRKGRVANINKAFSQHLNISKREAEGHHITEFLRMAAAKNEEEDILTLIEKTFKLAEKSHGEFSSGKQILSIHSFPIENSRGQIAKVLLMIMDVTMERSAERQMIQDNKMIAVGQLASGVAHEIRNPLGVIMNYCYVLKNLDTGDENARLEAIQIIERSVQRSGKIIDNLLNFSRVTTDKRERIEVKQHIQNILSLHSSFTEKKNITVDFDCSDDIVLFTGADPLDMIIINLLSNAADAISGEGAIRIKCTQEEKKVRIEVSDNGVGIKEEILDEIFNPFFTTKSRKEGNGLGLYVVYSEVQKLSGEITVESEPGKGTSFAIKIPVEGE